MRHFCKSSITLLLLPTLTSCKGNCCDRDQNVLPEILKQNKQLLQNLKKINLILLNAANNNKMIKYKGGLAYQIP